jgi:hypothetical protein
MLSADDWAQMAADLAEVRGDNQVSIVIRRGASTLAAQNVRIAGAGSGRSAQGSGTEAAVSSVVVLGATTLDIQPGDRFNDGAGVLYEVVAVRPNRRAAVTADAQAVQ